MPEADSTAFSRVCPACGRRVPRKVAQCRCGAKTPAEGVAQAASEPDEAPSSSDFAAGVRFGLIVALGLGVIGAGAFLITRRPPPPPKPVVAVARPIPVEEPPRELSAAGPVSPQPLPPEPPAPRPLPEVPAPQPVTAPISAASLEDIISDVMPAVVLVQTSESRGSGFYVKADTLVTNVHVVGSYSSVTIRKMDGTTLPARVELKSSDFDIAILKTSNPSPTQAIIPLGSSDNLRVGQEVLAIGSALGKFQNTVTRGIVSAIRHAGDATLVQTDAAVNPGNSGGPLLDRSGWAIGITTMGYTDRQGLNFAVGIDHARALLEGRSASSSSNTVARADDIRELSPSLASGADKIRADGERAFEETVAEQAKRADVLDGEWRRFREYCSAGQITGSFDRPWFAMLAPRSTTGQSIFDCGSYSSEMLRVATSFKDTMVRATEEARRAGVYPGVVRDALRKYRLSHEAWGR